MADVDNLVEMQWAVLAGMIVNPDSIGPVLAQLGPEFTVLRQTPAEAIASLAGDAAALGVELLRQGKVAWRPGFDGEYGKLSFPGR